MIVKTQSDIPIQEVENLCKKWGITELALFGSILRDDFGPESDIDVLVEFAPNVSLSSFDFLEIQDELSQLFGRKVDLVEKQGMRNPFRRREILRSFRVIFAA